MSQPNARCALFRVAPYIENYSSTLYPFPRVVLCISLYVVFNLCKSVR
jgi:hypothetical protein